MQYSIELPVQYDPERIRERVDKRSPLFSGLPGLVHKSYLYNADENIYAPFYIWSDVAQAQRFLFDDLFRGVIETFRRPRVRTWMVLSAKSGPATAPPRFARREADAIAPEDDLESLFAKERAAQDALLAHEHLHFHALALDASRWELIRYSLWKDEASAPAPSSDCVQAYEVLHPRQQ